MTANTWDQQEGEPTLWFWRFERYRTMGPARTVLGSVHLEEAEKSKPKKSACPSGYWTEQSVKWNWKQRAEQWDSHEVAEKRKAHKNNIPNIRRIWSAMAQGLRTKAIEALELVKPGDLSPKDIRDWLETSIRIEQLAGGLPLNPGSDSEDKQTAIAFYHEILDSPQATASERIKARERLDKLTGVDATEQGNGWQEVLESVKRRASEKLIKKPNDPGNPEA